MITRLVYLSSYVGIFYMHGMYWTICWMMTDILKMRRTWHCQTDYQMFTDSFSDES